MRGDSEFAEAEGEDALAKLQRELASLARAAVEDVPAAKLGAEKPKKMHRSKVFEVGLIS